MIITATQQVDNITVTATQSGNVQVLQPTIVVGTQGSVSSETAASIKTKYESNPDTNAFTDAEKTKLTGVGTIVWNETLSGTVDGSNKVFTTASPILGTNITLYVGRVMMLLGVDFTVTDAANGEITLTAGTPAPTTGEVVYAHQYQTT